MHNVSTNELKTIFRKFAQLPGCQCIVNYELEQVPEHTTQTGNQFTSVRLTQACSKIQM